MKAATHDGHCQVCGSFQRLPSGVLAKHGYEVIGRGSYGGYFSGTCWGSGNLPFEKSCDLVKLSIERAKDHILHLKNAAKALQAQVTEPKAVWQQYVSHVGRRGYYTTVNCTVEEVIENGHPTKYIVFDDHSGKKHREWATRYSLYGTSLEIAQKLNEQHADRLLKEVGQIKAYIAQQQERVSEWKEAPLIKRRA